MLVGALALVAALTAARPAEAGYLEDAGWGALTVLTNVFYMPAKLGYATLGGLTGGFAFALTGGDLQKAETVWVTSMGGTYVVTPGMLQARSRSSSPARRPGRTPPPTRARSRSVRSAEAESR